MYEANIELQNEKRKYSITHTQYFKRKRTTIANYKKTQNEIFTIFIPIVLSKMYIKVVLNKGYILHRLVSVISSAVI